MQGHGLQAQVPDWQPAGASALIDTAAVQAAEQVAKAAAGAWEAQVQLEQFQQQHAAARTIKIEQQFIGFVIGQGGEQLRQIREACGVTNIQIDQATKDRGFSMAQIFGPQEAADRAARMIIAKLAEIDPRRTPEGDFEEIRIEQSMVGLLLGRGGETLKAIKGRSGAAIAIDQSTKDAGYSTMRIIGDEQAKVLARDLIHAKMGEAKGPQPGVFEFKVEQSFVGWLIGRGGETVKQIKEQTGAAVVIDQATKDLGYSVVKIMPGPGAEAARSLIETKLAQVEAYGSTIQEIPVDQTAVGLLIGRGGETVRQIKEQSGATMVINQATKDAGYSVVRLGGTPEAIAKAARLVLRKLEEMRVGLGVGAVQLQAAAAGASVLPRSGARRAPDGLPASAAAPTAAPMFSAVPPPLFNAVPPPQPAAAASLGPPRFGAVPPPVAPASSVPALQGSAAGATSASSAEVAGAPQNSIGGEAPMVAGSPIADEKADVYDPFAE